MLHVLDILLVMIGPSLGRLDSWFRIRGYGNNSTPARGITRAYTHPTHLSANNLWRNATFGCLLSTVFKPLQSAVL